MKRAALGIQMHSGWGVVVVVSGNAESIEVVARERIEVVDSAIPGVKQPYHHAARLALPESEKYLADCAASSERLAATAIGEVLAQLNGRQYQIVRAAILTGAGRAMPALAKILAAHPLIHTAEGEFFRNAARKGCESLKIAVATIRQRDLDDQMKAAFGARAGRLQHRIETLGRAIGPPWAKDYKTAAMAALIALGGNQTPLGDGDAISRQQRKNGPIAGAKSRGYGIGRYVRKGDARRRPASRNSASGSDAE